MTREPVRTIGELETLNSDEIMEGYRSGFVDRDPEPGENRSRGFWHGWRNGARDRGLIPGDDAMAQLAHEVVKTGCLRRYQI